MEGDTPQSMYAMWWKEICDSDTGVTDCPPTKTCAGTSGEPIVDSWTSTYTTSSIPRTTYFPNSQYTFDNEGCYFDHTANPAFEFYCLDWTCTYRANQMIRMRRLWQFPSYSPVNPLPSDVWNHETQVLYTSSDSRIEANYGWMMGDVVPMNSCAYVVSQSTAVNGGSIDINYNFEQWVMSIKANDVLAQRAVMLRQNYAKTFTASTSGTAVDVIRNNNKVFWYPYWAAFYWFANGRLIIKVDQSYDISGTDIENKPCLSTDPIFTCTGYSDTDCIKHVTLAMTGTFGSCDDCVFNDHVWVFGFMYFVVNANNNNVNVVYKLNGSPRESGSTGTLNVVTYITGYQNTSTTIRSIQSLEKFGFYMTTENGGTQTVTQYELKM